MLVPVILAGGSGTRLWPLSRQQFPKQFLPLAGASSMLEETVARLAGLEAAAPTVVCHEDHRFLVADQLSRCGLIDGGQILLEAHARNTAASVALAAFAAITDQAARGDDSDPVLLVLSADHHLGNREGFQASVASACQLAAQGYLVALGACPDRAETGYGYMRIGECLGNGGVKVEAFKEKPDADTARAYLASEKYWWNTGIFVIQAGRYLHELAQWQPAIHAACQAAMESAVKDLDFMRPDAEALARCPRMSIDVAVMEPTRDAASLLIDSDWSDLGSWEALWQLGAKDTAGNVSSGDVVLVDSHDSLVSSTGPLVTALGLDGMVVVATDDAVMVTRREHGSDVKALIDRLTSEQRPELTTPSRVYRPWGNYRVVNSGGRYQVKQITVKPGKTLSLQRHHHRSEHWVVVSGTAEVTLQDATYLLGENESTYIPLGKVHRLNNPGIIDLELIEVQSGSYLGEDDIERLSDHYGRH